jgi:ankyrin repeat protein
VEVNAPCTGPYAETPLHWAASSNDVDALDALLEAAADIEAPGAVFYGGTPLADAVGFGQWQAARHLIEHGARTTLWQAAALGLRARIRDCFPDRARPAAEDVNAAFWYACRGGQFNAAIFLLHERADLNWIPKGEKQTPLDAARLGGAADLVKWLHTHGAKPAAELRWQCPAGLATSANPFP